MINAFSIGLSALQANQTALDVIGQNLANASTPGYDRQITNLASTNTGSTGTGVTVSTINRETAQPLRTAILQGNAQQAYSNTQLGIQTQVQSTLTAGSTPSTTTGTSTGSIGDALTSFFNQVTTLTSSPDDSSVRTTLIGTASALTGQFNLASNGLQSLKTSTTNQISQTITTVNSLASRIANLNQQIASNTVQNGQANDLQNQRDELISQLSQQVDVQVVQQPLGQVNVLSSGTPIVLTNEANTFSVAPNASGSLVVSQTLASQPATFASGTLAAQLNEVNQSIPTTLTQLDTLANTLSAKVNEIQATGLGTAGPLTTSSGTTEVASTTAALSTQNLPAPVQAGQLTISITNTATGNRTNSTISIDPTTQSLQQVAAAITSGTGGQVQATVDPTSNTLQLNAQTGYSFDFAGRDTIPASTGQPVANPDTSGILAGLGINGLFAGNGAGAITVNPAISANPGLLSSSTTGQAGDESNLEKLVALQTQNVIGNQTLSGSFTNLATSIGSTVQQLNDQQTSQAAVVLSLSNQEQSVVGVDQNQELVNLLSGQKGIQAASQYISAVNTALDSIFKIIQ